MKRIFAIGLLAAIAAGGCEGGPQGGTEDRPVAACSDAGKVRKLQEQLKTVVNGLAPLQAAMERASATSAPQAEAAYLEALRTSLPTLTRITSNANDIDNQSDVAVRISCKVVAADAAMQKAYLPPRARTDGGGASDAATARDIARDAVALCKGAGNASDPLTPERCSLAHLILVGAPGLQTAQALDEKVRQGAATTTEAEFSNLAATLKQYGDMSNELQATAETLRLLDGNGGEQARKALVYAKRPVCDVYFKGRTLLNSRPADSDAERLAAWRTYRTAFTGTTAMLAGAFGLQAAAEPSCEPGDANCPMREALARMCLSL